MQLRYNYRAYLTPAERSAAGRALGCARVVWNDALAYRQAAHEAGERYPTDGPKAAPPRFKSRKDSRQSLRFTANSRFKILPDGLLRLPKIGEIQVRWTRDLPAAPTPVTLTRDAAGRYFVSFVVEAGLRPLPARKVKGSNRRGKARVKVARAHAHVADARRDFHHKLSTMIIRESQAVYVEDLAVRGLARTRLAKSVHDAGWSSSTRMLEYKAALYGREFARTGRFEPTSQTCSACGVKDGPKPLQVREWQCTACGAGHDRDVNAAKNILALGRRESLNARGGQVRPAATPAPAREAGSLRGAA